MMMHFKRITLALLVSFSLTSCFSQSEANGMENRSADEVMKIADKPDVVIIDVRTPGEVSNGYLKGTDYFIDINDAGFTEKIDALDKSKTYVVICHSGARSARAANYMLDNGFDKIINMAGGMSSVKDSSFITR
jgi:phage shock protein E